MVKSVHCCCVLAFVASNQIASILKMLSFKSIKTTCTTCNKNPLELKKAVQSRKVILKWEAFIYMFGWRSDLTSCKPDADQITVASGGSEQWLCNGCNMGIRDLPSIYSRSPRAIGLKAYISNKSQAPML